MANKFQPGNQAARGHGAPRGNSNAMKSGLRSRRPRFGTGELPDGCEVIGLTVDKLRSMLERAVTEIHGEVSLKHSLYVHSACRHEAVAQLTQRWLRLHADSMSHGERLAYLSAVAAESDKRDRAVERLNLDPAETGSILDALYAAQVTPEPADSEGEQHASD